MDYRLARSSAAFYITTHRRNLLIDESIILLGKRKDPMGLDQGVVVRSGTVVASLLRRVTNVATSRRKNPVCERADNGFRQANARRAAVVGDPAAHRTQRLPTLALSPASSLCRIPLACSPGLRRRLAGQPLAGPHPTAGRCALWPPTCTRPVRPYIRADAQVPTIHRTNSTSFIFPTFAALSPPFSKNSGSDHPRTYGSGMDLERGARRHRLRHAGPPMSAT